MHTLTKSYNRKYYRNRLKHRVVYYRAFTRIKIKLYFKLTMLFVASKLLKLAFWICPELKWQLGLR